MKTSSIVRRFVVAALILCCAVFIWTHQTIETERNKSVSSGRELTGIRYLINSSSCAIPYFDPFDPEAASLGEELSPVDCGSRPALTYLRHQIIHVNHSVLGKDGVKHCLYKAIQSPSGTGRDLETGKPIKFWDKIEFKDEFAVVECLGEKGEVLYDDAYAQILDKTPSAERSSERLEEFRRRESPAETLSVLILLTDSTSRLSFHRLMGKTRSLLLEEMGALEFLAHMKVGENTRPNLYPLFSGRSLDESRASLTTPDGERDYQDNLPFIWKNLSAHGYRTLFAEDSNMAGTFQYEPARLFFRKSPYDYDYRSLGYYMENTTRTWGTGCIGNRLMAESMLDWTSQFVEKHQKTPFFAVVFNSRYSHYAYNGPAMYDNIYHQYINMWHSRNLLNNTVLVFGGDHGLRFGPGRLRYRGRVEDHTPLLTVRFPPWFSRKYSAIQRALETNRGRLSSHYDVHATLLHLLHFRGPVPVHLAPRRGQSLLTELPRDRSCPDAGIPPAYCICQTPMETSVPINLTSVPDKLLRFLRVAAMKIVTDINNRLQRYGGRCAIFDLDGIVSARDQSLLAEGVTTNPRGKHPAKERRYLMTIKVKPGGGIFETLISYSRGARRPYRVHEDIFRINMYGNQSHCIPVKEHEGRSMCFCTRQQSSD